MKEVTVIPVKVELLCHLYEVLTQYHIYAKYIAEENNDEVVMEQWLDNNWTLALLENQIKLGVKYAK